MIPLGILGGVLLVVAVLCILKAMRMESEMDWSKVVEDARRFLEP